ncbi:porin family protein [Qipengyuania sp. S6317L1]|uniref:outer membrane protein n=1 Tax=Qipengyuania sp. S6317L1 TaxID=2926410 RepID=UPI001FF30ADD|nr:porin family protein [Qipengyuania sp. S6317L1]MCK0099272.1 porin family protein [Qipengyuania sp. S6317L1]
MNYKLYLLAAASVAATSAPAMAQSSDDPFTGPRVGVIAGFDTSRAGSDVDDDLNEDNDESIEGFGYGVEAGYDFNAGGVVLGVEAELSDSTAEVEVDEGDFEGFGFGDVESGRDIYLGARIGARVGENALVYAKGGYTNARYNVSASFDGDEFRSSIDTDGFRLGAGLEYLLGTNTYAKVEYRYSNYTDAEIDFEDDGLGDVELGDIDLDRHQVMAGVGFRF